MTRAQTMACMEGIIEYSQPVGQLASKLKQKQRSTEASRQMLYDVFGFVIAMLEEFESRELEQKGKDPNMMPKSNIQTPEQKHKSFDDVKGILEAQLVMFESQLSACPKKAKNKIKNQLKWKTFDWAAIRAEKFPDVFSETDRYLAQLYEILSTGRTRHPECEEVTIEDMVSFIPALIAGSHKQEEFDKSFIHNRDKKAVPIAVRASHIEMMFKKGAERVEKYLPENLHEVVAMDLKEFEKIVANEKKIKRAQEIEKEADKKQSIT